MRPLAIALAPRRTSKRWTSTEIEWSELISWAEQPGDRKEAGNYLLGTMEGDRRLKTTIVDRSAITLDADDTALEDLPDIVEMAFPYAAIVHTTYSSTPDQPRYRVIVPVDRPLLPDEYVFAAEALAQMLGGLDHFDRGSLEPERYMFRPATADPANYTYRVVEGPPIPAEELLEGFEPDLTNEKVPRTYWKRDPQEIGGPVGAFNRVYDFQEAIEKFGLPYTPAEPGRWTLNGTRAVAGLNDIGGGFVFSHHSTDPAYGQTCSVFDLVRLHRFGDLDERAKPDTPINRLPSHEAMLDLAISDEKVKEEIGSDFEAWTDDMDDDSAAPDPNWTTNFLFDRNSKIRDHIVNWDLIANHDPAVQRLRYNDMTFSTETSGDLPWRPLEKGGYPFSEADRSALRDYIERVYDLRASRERVDALIFDVSRRNWYNPVKDYLSGLEWDGIPRVETCLPGVTPTPYTRMVARKSLVAAVARVFEPGIKWDHTLVFYGKENLGKSYWVDRLSRGWSASLGRPDNKDTWLTMHRSWIMMADEGFSLKKADQDVLKEFLTRTTDVFRLPYDREVTDHPRRCVIWGTTNDDVFLRRQEGNRRYLIVHSERPVDFGELTDDYIDQLWAEAMALYTLGEALYLSNDQTLMSAQEREAYTEEEPNQGVVERYLDMPVPDDWDDRSIEARRMYISNFEDGVEVGDQQIRTVCTAQLWVEALGRAQSTWNRADLLTLASIMKRLPEWQIQPGRHRIKNYGPQTVFVRKTQEEA